MWTVVGVNFSCREGVINRRLQIQANIEVILTDCHNYQSLVGNNGMALTKKIRIKFG